MIEILYGQNSKFLLTKWAFFYIVAHQRKNDKGTNMAKLTAAQRRSIETILYHLERAQKFVQDDATIIARKKSQCTTTLDFEIPGHGAASSIAKDIGSDLAGFQMGIDYLKNFVKFNE